MHAGSIARECIKLMVKQTENLRSQVAKNACMALQVIYSELPAKDLDANLDLVLHAMIKKATDTNHFVSEQAEKALTMICNSCTDLKVLNSLMTVEGRANNLKQKVVLCYCFLLEKLGQKLKLFKENTRLAKQIINMLQEGAVEVRNQAKVAVMQMRQFMQNQREFENLLVRSGVSDKQIEQVRKILDL